MAKRYVVRLTDEERERLAGQRPVVDGDLEFRATDGDPIGVLARRDAPILGGVVAGERIGGSAAPADLVEFGLSRPRHNIPALARIS